MTYVKCCIDQEETALQESEKSFRKKQCDFNELLMNGWRTGEKHLYTVASLKTGDLLKD